MSEPTNNDEAAEQKPVFYISTPESSVGSAEDAAAQISVAASEAAADDSNGAPTGETTNEDKKEGPVEENVLMEDDLDQTVANNVTGTPPYEGRDEEGELRVDTPRPSPYRVSDPEDVVYGNTPMASPIKDGESDEAVAAATDSDAVDENGMSVQTPTTSNEVKIDNAAAQKKKDKKRKRHRKRKLMLAIKRQRHIDETDSEGSPMEAP